MPSLFELPKIESADLAPSDFGEVVDAMNEMCPAPPQYDDNGALLPNSPGIGAMETAVITSMIGNEFIEYCFSLQDPDRLRTFHDLLSHKLNENKLRDLLSGFKSQASH